MKLDLGIGFEPSFPFLPRSIGWFVFEFGLSKFGVEKRFRGLVDLPADSMFFSTETIRGARNRGERVIKEGFTSLIILSTDLYKCYNREHVAYKRKNTECYNFKGPEKNFSRKLLLNSQHADELNSFLTLISFLTCMLICKTVFPCETNLCLTITASRPPLKLEHEDYICSVWTLISQILPLTLHFEI